MNSINFVTGKSLELEDQLKKVRYLRIIAIVSLIIVASLSVFVFVITVLLPISSVKKEQDQTLIGISQLHKKLTTHVLIKDRLGNISSVSTLRKTFPQISDSIVNKLPEDLSVTVFDIENGNFIMTVSGSSLFSINQFIDDVIVVTDKNKKIKNFMVSSLHYNEEKKIYDLTIQADIL